MGSLRIRGQEISIRFLVDNVPVGGSWTKLKDLEHTPRTDHKETDFLGESESDTDIQHHGHDLTATLDNMDSLLVDFLDELVAREEEHLPPQDVQTQLLYSFREPGNRNKLVTYYNGNIKVDSEGFRGRKEYVETKVSMKYKKRRTITL